MASFLFRVIWRGDLNFCICIIPMPVCAGFAGTGVVVERDVLVQNASESATARINRPKIPVRLCPNHIHVKKTGRSKTRKEVKRLWAKLHNGAEEFS